MCFWYSGFVNMDSSLMHINIVGGEFLLLGRLLLCHPASCLPICPILLSGGIGELLSWICTSQRAWLKARFRSYCHRGSLNLRTSGVRKTPLQMVGRAVARRVAMNKQGMCARESSHRNFKTNTDTSGAPTMTTHNPRLDVAHGGFHLL